MAAASYSIDTRLPGLGTTIFTVMSQLAREHNAINLAQGYPDFGCDPALIELVNKYISRGFNQYSPMPGVMALREKISEKTKELYGACYDPETEVTISCGATEACFAAISSLLRPGDEVILFEPAFDVYLPAIRLAGAIPVYTELHYPHYRIDWDEVKSKISSKTRLIIMNSPHNPTGTVISQEDIIALKEIIQTNDIFIISDEVYEHIIFDDRKHESLILYPELRERTMVLSSFGKTFHTTGWRMGYCVAPAYLSAEFRKFHQFITFSAVTPMQYAIAEYLQDKENYVHLPAFYQKKRDKFLKLMAGSAFTMVPSSGTFFQLMSYKNIMEEQDVQFAERLTREIGVASIPVSVFYHKRNDEKVLRFCFAKEDTTLENAAERLCRI